MTENAQDASSIMYRYVRGRKSRRHAACALSFLLCLVLALSGCLDAPPAKWPPKPISFRHTEGAFGVPFALTVLLVHDTCGKYAGYAVMPVGAVLGAACAPLGLAVDLLEVPVNIADMIKYKLNPPLGYLIETGDYARLVKQLEGGANPNAYFSTDRYPGYPPALEVAVNTRNREALEILLAHGATMPQALADAMVASPYGFYHHYRQKEDILPFFKRLFDAFPDYPYHECGHGSAKSLILEYCLFFYADERRHVSENPVVDELFQTLLERKFDPNYLNPDKHNRLRMTALDCLLFQTPNLAPERRKKLVALMRQHGALRYPEIVQRNPDMSPLPIDGVQYDPAFAPVVEMLKYTTTPQLYRFSTDYPDMEGPVLVIDFGKYKDPKDKSTLFFRRTLEEAREDKASPRPSIEKGQKIDMDFEVPVRLRMVLTLPGRKRPTRITLHGAGSGRFIYEQALHEDWFTLPTCEIYVERAVTNLHLWSGMAPSEALLVMELANNYMTQSSSLNHVLEALMNLDKLPPPE